MIVKSVHPAYELTSADKHTAPVSAALLDCIERSCGLFYRTDFTLGKLGVLGQPQHSQNVHTFTYIHDSVVLKAPTCLLTLLVIMIVYS